MSLTTSYGYAQCPEGRIHYAEAGAGDVLLLLHATPRSHRSFRNMLPLLAPHCRAIAIDAPGFGNSDPLPARVSVESVAARLISFLNSMGIARANVFGLHTGNKLAAAMAAFWPGRVASVIIAGQTHSLIVDNESRDAAIHAFFDRYPPRYAESPDGAHYIREWAAAHAEAQDLWWSQNLISAPKIERRDLEYAEARVIDYLLGRRSITPIYEAIFAFDFTAALAQIEAPALVLELLTPSEAHFGEQAAQLCAMMKRARPAKIENADRSSLEGRPADVVRPVREFLQANG